MEKKGSGDISILKELDSFRCDNIIQYPYYPVIAITTLNSDTYVAAKSKDTLVIYVFQSDACIRSYSINSSTLPSKSFITAILFVSPQNVYKIGAEDSGTLYMLIGYYCGYLYLVKINKKEVKIITKYNKVSETGLLSKTMSYFSGTSSGEYTKWQNATVIKIKTLNKTLSYLFRNGILVIMGTLDSNIDDLQKRYEWMVSQVNLQKNTMMKMQRYYYYICNEYKLIRSNESCIFSFNNTISSYEVTQSSVFISTFEGAVFEFERQSYQCIRRISTMIAVKCLSVFQKYLVLCLEDDITQIIDLGVNKYINIIGHRSFTNCCLTLKSTLLLGGYDGSISITNLLKVKEWRKFQSENKTQQTFSLNPLGIEVDLKSKLKSEVGIGAGVIENDIVVFSMFDNTIKVFKINFQHLQK